MERKEYKEFSTAELTSARFAIQILLDLEMEFTPAEMDRIEDELIYRRRENIG